MLSEDHKIAAMYGPQFVPFFRRQKKKITNNDIHDISHRETMNVLKRVEWFEWDFVYALGDTIMEKYESLYIKVVETCRDIDDTQRITITRLVSGPEISSIFETATAGFCPTYVSLKDDIVYAGLINCRWRLYKDYQIDKDVLLLTTQDMEGGAAIRLINFVI